MTREEIETWLVESYNKTVKCLELSPGWWPTATGNNQQLASAWCWALFALAAKERCAGRRLTVAASQSGAKGKVLESIWPRDRITKSRDMSPNEVLLDFSVHHWRSSTPVQLTAESEMTAQHPIEESENLTSNDYSWDFYKLLVVPSQTRLFTARLGSLGETTYKERRRKLTECLEDLVDRYGSAFLRPHDELGAVIIPAAKRDIEYTRVLWTDRGRLKHRDISETTVAALTGGEQMKVPSIP